MHPAKSVILFTTLSGAGYGLLAVILAADLFFDYSLNITFFNWAMATAFVLVTAGLLSSTFHLGHPERAWRAISQWRSSWLSREGVLALLTFIPWLVWVGIHNYEIDLVASFAPIAWITMGLSVSTVFATAMIYRSLKPVQAWYHPSVVFIYLWLACASGLLLLLLFAFFSQKATGNLLQLTLSFVGGAILLKLYYWQFVLSRPSRSTLESATGLGFLGSVQSFEWPHNNANYLMQEMGFQIARKHRMKLRRMVCLCWGFVLIALILFNQLQGASVTMLAALLVGMLVLFLIGLLVERWLFFAEAKHDQALYYGQS